MFLNTVDVKLTPRIEATPYHLKINESTLEVLSLIFEFKLAANWHIARFLTCRDQSKYLYTKLRRMWQAGLLESFKIHSGSVVGIPVFYMLSKSALRILEERGMYSTTQLRAYPTPSALLSAGLFRHEIQVVELASLEIQNKSFSFHISFKGEATSQRQDYLSDKQIEVLTPDYTVFYKIGQVEQHTYTEFERTMKSKQAILRKIERYIAYLSSEERKSKTLRIIFQTPEMERSFWLNIVSSRPILLQKLRILTTNLTLLSNYRQFLEPIYLSDATVQFFKNGPLHANSTGRIKLFSFL